MTRILQRYNPYAAEYQEADDTGITPSKVPLVFDIFEQYGQVLHASVQAGYNYWGRCATNKIALFAKAQWFSFLQGVAKVPSDLVIVKNCLLYSNLFLQILEFVFAMKNLALGRNDKLESEYNSPEEEALAIIVDDRSEDDDSDKLIKKKNKNTINKQQQQTTTTKTNNAKDIVVDDVSDDDDILSTSPSSPAIEPTQELTADEKLLWDQGYGKFKILSICSHSLYRCDE